jgi:hypothetical protein
VSEDVNMVIKEGILLYLVFKQTHLITTVWSVMSFNHLKSTGYHSVWVHRTGVSGPNHLDFFYIVRVLAVDSRKATNASNAMQNSGSHQVYS